MRHVPVLELDLELDLGGTRRYLAESLAILEHLEESIPNPPLLPKDPFLRARTRQLAMVVVSGIQPLQNTKVQEHVQDVLHEDLAAWVKRWVEPGLESFEMLVGETAWTFCVGEQLTFAECCLVPQLAFSRRFGIELERWPTLARIEAACASLPAFERAHSDRQIDAGRQTRG